VIGRIQFL